jgi:glutaredoxin
MTVTVELVGARGCCLCDEARAVLEEHRERLGYRIAEVDITGDDALERAYREHIPVVFVNGERAFVYRVETAALARAVAAARAADEAAE